GKWQCHGLVLASLSLNAGPRESVDPPWNGAAHWGGATEPRTTSAHRRGLFAPVLRRIVLAQQLCEDAQSPVRLLLARVTEVEPQCTGSAHAIREERLARHERHTALNRRRQECPGVERAVERDPEEQAAAGHVPGRDAAEMLLQTGRENIALAAIRGND